ncbi:MAG: ATP-grasp domain-containing protein [Desulfobacterales bacterium]|nr:ATP-grasp domain-containing protein [Desulfobacterales bacterium]
MERKTGFQMSDLVLVIGTTPDYVVRIQNSHPDTAFFILSEIFKKHDLLETIPNRKMVFAPFENFRATLQVVNHFLNSERLRPCAIACFDCESLMIAARLALALGIKFALPTSISFCRNKFKAKRIWNSIGIPTPSGILAANLEETLNFFQANPAGIVLKPISGSGSELVFCCSSQTQVKESVDIIKEELYRRRTHPLYESLSTSFSAGYDLDSCRSWVAEAFIAGPEYSCDFILDEGQIRIIRTTGKIMAPDQTFGSVFAYTFPAEFPDGFAIEALMDTLKKAATALGFNWGHFMADFIINHNTPIILELSPRPGGDSIPDLIQIASKKNILGVHLDFVCGKLDLSNFPIKASNRFASINLFIPEEGIIEHLDVSTLFAHREVKDVVLKKGVGDKITLPPSDYDNRLLGHCLLSTKGVTDLLALSKKLNAEINLHLSHP